MADFPGEPSPCTCRMPLTTHEGFIRVCPVHDFFICSSVVPLTAKEKFAVGREIASFQFFLMNSTPTERDRISS